MTEKEIILIAYLAYGFLSMAVLWYLVIKDESNNQ